MEVTWDVQQMFTNRHQGAFEKERCGFTPKGLKG